MRRARPKHRVLRTCSNTCANAFSPQGSLDMRAGHAVAAKREVGFQDLLKRGSHASASNQTHSKSQSPGFSWQPAYCQYANFQIREAVGPERSRRPYAPFPVLLERVPATPASGCRRSRLARLPDGRLKHAGWTEARSPFSGPEAARALKAPRCLRSRDRAARTRRRRHRKRHAEGGCPPDC